MIVRADGFDKAIAKARLANWNERLLATAQRAKANRPVGAELRGSGSRVWRGMAPGSRKDLGYFWVGARGSNRRRPCNFREIGL